MNTKTENPFFFIRYAGRYQKVSFADILYIEACKNYCRIVMQNRVYMFRQALPRRVLILQRETTCSEAHEASFLEAETF